MTRYNMMMIPLLLAAIGMAFTLPTWLAVIQASFAAFSLGIKCAEIMDDRDKARKVMD